ASAARPTTRADDVPSPIGDWTGIETQVNPSGSYQADLHIRQLRLNEIDGSVTYSGGTTFAIDCEADLTLTSITDYPAILPKYIFQETLTTNRIGNCVDAIDTVKLVDADT